MTMTYTAFHAPSLYDRAEQESRKGKGVITAILCAAAAEAFLHDLAECYLLALEHKKICPNQKDNSFPKRKFEVCVTPLHNFLPEEESIYQLLNNLEDAKCQPVDKYTKVFELIGSPSKPETLQNLGQLLKIRNGIVHMKGETISIKTNENGAEFSGYPKFLNDFKQKKMLAENKNPVSWLELIETEKFSNWCLSTVRNLTDEILLRLPDGYLSKEFKAQSKL